MHLTLKQEGGREHFYHFELPRDEWKQVHASKYGAWVDALNELMTRSSDRAYYHVPNRLACDFGEEVTMEEEALWSDQWGSTVLREAERAETTVEDIGKVLEDIGF